MADTLLGEVALPAVIADGRLLAARVDGTEVSFSRTLGSSAVAGVQASQGTGAGRGLLYGTFLGGSDDDEYNGVDLAVGPDGSTYVAGTTFSSDFPTTPGAFDTTYDDEVGFAGDAYVSRLDPSGSTLLYSTFLGGGSTEDLWSLAVGPDGSAYVGGNTRSVDYPTTPGSFSPTFNGGCCDGFVTRLNPEGGALVYSTYLGGSESTESVYALALAPDGTVYATGETLSADFPVTLGAFDTTINNDGVGLYSDAFVAALNPAGTDLVYSTYLGGRFNDIAWAIAVGPDGTAYVTGFAQSPEFPTTPGAFDETFNGGNNDLFVTQLTQPGTGLVFSTYLGGNDHDDGRAIGLDEAGNVYVVGDTNSPDYPTTPGAYDTTINSYILRDAFATRLNPTGSALVYSTFLGGEDAEVWPDLSVDPDGTLTLTGQTYSADFPTTPGAFDRTFGPPTDAFVSRFDPSGGHLLYSSFLGGSGRRAGDAGDAIAPAGPGAVSVAGSTGAENFPVTPGAYDTTYNGGADAFVATLRVAPTIHVDRIVPFYRPVGEGYVVGAGIRILSQTGAPVEGAEITVEIASPDGSEIVATGETSPRGIAAVARPASETGTYTFTVLAVARTGAAYDPSQNGETSDSVTIP